MSDLRSLCEYIAEDVTKMVNDPETWMKENYVDEDYCYHISAWMDDAMDIEMFIGFNGTYRGARIMVAYGGPNIYVNTRTGTVDGYWGSEQASVEIPSEVCEALDEYIDDIRCDMREY